MQAQALARSNSSAHASYAAVAGAKSSPLAQQSYKSMLLKQPVSILKRPSPQRSEKCSNEMPSKLPSPPSWLQRYALNKNAELDWNLVRGLFQFTSVERSDTLRKQLFPVELGSITTTPETALDGDGKSPSLTASTSLAVASYASVLREERGGEQPAWPKDEDKALSDVLSNLVAGKDTLPLTTAVRPFEPIVVPPDSGFDDDNEDFMTKFMKRGKLRKQVRRYARANHGSHYRVTILVASDGPPVQFRVFLSPGKQFMSKEEKPDFVGLGLSGLFDWMGHWKYEMYFVVPHFKPVFDVWFSESDVRMNDAAEHEVKAFLEERYQSR